MSDWLQAGTQGLGSVTAQRGDAVAFSEPRPYSPRRSPAKAGGSGPRVMLAALRPGLSLTDLQGSVKGPSLTLGVLKEPPELSRTPGTPASIASLACDQQTV